MSRSALGMSQYGSIHVIEGSCGEQQMTDEPVMRLFKENKTHNDMTTYEDNDNI